MKYRDILSVPLGALEVRILSLDLYLKPSGNHWEQSIRSVPGKSTSLGGSGGIA